MSKPLIIWGGVDVNPAYYNETPLKYTQRPDTERDAAEFAAVRDAIDKGDPIIGICRGAQLLCVANGGSLWQHTRPGHQQHPITTLDGKTFPTVAAGHHQIMRPKGNFIIYGWNPELVQIWDDNDNFHYEKNTYEVIYFPDTKCLCIQPHPEWAGENDPFVKWVNNLLEELGFNFKF